MKITYKNPVSEGGDPFVLYHDGKYYLYATTCSDQGYIIRVSDDLVNWHEEGFCLEKKDVLGEKNFWAPEVMFHNGLFYMAYSADWHLGIAVSDSPTGPFKQEEKKWACSEQAIDGSFFKDDDGRIYLYYVHQTSNGRYINQIYAAQMNDDLTGIIEETERLLIDPCEDWEVRERARTAEGPFVLKNNGKYYLTYSVNDFQSVYYSVGCAVSDSPLGPFKKLKGNPILKRSEFVNGTGHHSFTRTEDGQIICVYHTHNSPTVVNPRKICIDKAEFGTNELGEETIIIHGPTHTEQTL